MTLLASSHGSSRFAGPLFAGLLKAAALGAALALGGCVGGGSAPSPSSSEPSSMRLAIFGNPQAIPAARNPDLDRNYTCPTVDIIEGAAAFRMGAGGRDVGLQASLNDVARECDFGGRTVTMKVGVQGRLLLGAAGKPGTYAVPVRVAVKRGEAVVASRFARVQVTVPAGETSVAFTHVETGITAPMSESDPGDEYEIYVGFDAKGGPADPRSGRRKRR